MMLYIFWFLHQTTTLHLLDVLGARLYIFWFLHQTTTISVSAGSSCRCISFDSYIKPQPVCRSTHFSLVVYLLIPTSNHNSRSLRPEHYSLYIFWFLHQTTTRMLMATIGAGCISFDSYIKPQLIISIIEFQCVVYLLIPTSNHNTDGSFVISPPVVYLLIPTSNHNLFITIHTIILLYIFWFLHQTTTRSWCPHPCERCISFDSYIKPQR